jgi:hypothetical protein
LIYSEAKLKLTIPVEFGRPQLQHQDSTYKAWDGSTEMFDRHQIGAIERNTFDALDHLGIRYTNVR